MCRFPILLQLVHRDTNAKGPLCASLQLVCYLIEQQHLMPWDENALKFHRRKKKVPNFHATLWQNPKFL